MDHSYILRELPNPLKPLRTLSLDLRWTWSHAGDTLWRYLDPAAYETAQNPWVILQNTPHKRLMELADDKNFLHELKLIMDERDTYIKTARWFQENHPNALRGPIAYFSMEIGLGEGLPLYAGGLGVLAGDHLKAASDLGVPLVAVSLLYQQGYFRQMLDAEGRQQEFFPYNDPVSLPIRPARKDDGDWLRVHIDLPGRTLILRVWEAQVGQVTLYLLDSNDPMNSPADRGITGELYGGDRETRLLQEITLGVGGWKALMALGVRPEVMHMNEGHAAFAALERVKAFMRTQSLGFGEALLATRTGNVFTTHTPVKAGFDVFDPALITKYFRDYAETLDIPLNRLLALGRKAQNDQQEPFNMTYLALRTSGAVNGVSRLHGSVSRRIFQPLYPHWPESDVPVNYVTNGVHVPSWDSPHADQLWTKTCGKSRWLGPPEILRKKIEMLSDEDLWEFRNHGRRYFIDYSRERLAQQLRLQGASHQAIVRAESVLDPYTLTLGFARRFTKYKRPTLLLHDEDRLIRLLTNQQRPVQLIIAGKAHPQDEVGKRLVRQMVSFASRPEVRDKVVFLADYDMALAEFLAQGVDLWINTPLRPMEACGTSGMKILVNGGLNLSELDGWWAEAYNPEVGWALDSGTHGQGSSNDAMDAENLYNILEKEAIPTFYDRDNRGIPCEWVNRVRLSMAILTPRFSANRMLVEYVENYYLPAASALSRRTENNTNLACELLKWQQLLEKHWNAIHFLNLEITSNKSDYNFQAQVYLDDLPPGNVHVEIYAEPRGNGEASFRKPMKRIRELSGDINGYIYETTVPNDRPPDHYTPRIIPSHQYANVPLEELHILWYK